MNTCACTLDLLYLILPTGSYPQYQAVHIVFYTWLIGAYLLENIPFEDRYAIPESLKN
jgi:hypothetical protein